MKTSMAFVGAMMVLVGCAAEAAKRELPTRTDDVARDQGSEDPESTDDALQASSENELAPPGGDASAPDPPAPAPAPAPAPPPTTCTDGANACGKADGTDKGNVYTCSGGQWTRSKTCSYGCSGGACKPNPFQACCDLVKTLTSPGNDNLCFAQPGTSACPMTAAGGYCDPNGDRSYTDGDWKRGYDEFRTYCR